MTAERGSLAFLEYRRPVHLEDRLIGILVFLAVAHVGGRGRGTGKVEALDSLEDVWNSRVYGPASSKLGVVRQAETIDPRRNFHSLWPHVRLTFSGTSNYISDTPDEVSCKVIAKLAV